MSGPQYSVEFGANSDGMLRAVQGLHQALDKTVAKLNQVAQKSDAASQKSAQGFTKAGQAANLAGTQMMRFVSGASGIGSVLGGFIAIARQLKVEYDDLLRRQGQAAKTQISVAAAQRGAIENLGNDPTLSVANLNKRIAEIQQRTGAGQGALFSAASGAFSFKGRGITAAQALEAVEAAATQSPDDQAAIDTTTRAILSIQKRAPGTKASDIAGFITASKQSSPVVSNQAFAQNIAPGIADLVGFGNTPQQSAALLAAMGQGMNDSEGATTRTAALTLAKQVMEATPKMKGSTLDRLAFIQSEEGTAVRKRLLGPMLDEAGAAEKAGLSGEAKAFTTMAGLLQSGETAQKTELANTLRDIPTIANAGKVFKQTMANINSQPLQQQAALQRSLASGAEGIQIGDIVGGRASISRAGMEEVLQSSGLNTIAQRAILGEFEIATRGGTQAPVDQIAKSFRERASYLSRTEEYVSSGVGGQGVAIPRTPSSEDSRLANALTQLASSLEGFQKSVQENTKATQQNSDAAKVEPKPRFSDPHHNWGKRPSSGLSRR